MYKKAIKLADQILQRFPENGKTIAMKGLITGLGLKDMKEGFALAKTGLRYDMKNHITWHVYGLLYRNDRNYDQAMKCYQQALKINEGNTNILKDLALLQVQQRNFNKYCELSCIYNFFYSWDIGFICVVDFMFFWFKLFF